MGCSSSRPDGGQYPPVDTEAWTPEDGSEPPPLEGMVMFRTPVANKFMKHMCSLEDGELNYSIEELRLDGVRPAARVVHARRLGDKQQRGRAARSGG